MARKSRGLLAAAATFAASPQGRRLIAQAKAYAQRPENREKVQRAIADVRSRRKSGPAGTTGTSPDYGTPPKR